jgi:hypothetical protein
VPSRVTNDRLVEILYSRRYWPDNSGHATQLRLLNVLDMMTGLGNYCNRMLWCCGAVTRRQAVEGFSSTSEIKMLKAGHVAVTNYVQYDRPTYRNVERV